MITVYDDEVCENKILFQIPDFQLYYVEPVDGKIWSTISNKWLQPTKSKTTGYHQVTLCENGNRHLY